MTWTVRVRASALREIDEAHRWYAGQSASAATRFLADVRTGLALIGQRPESFPSHRRGTRRLLLQDFPYLVVFRQLPDHIEVMAVAHASRRPAYGRRRL